jgi:CDP-diacylglycerol--glycerol-3-phosphate 3-phosphatidyltransferase
MITDRIGQGGKWLLDRLVRILSALRINPNFLTLLGFIINIFAAYCLAYGQFLLAAAVIFLAGAFDMLDGAVARITHTASPFGAFFDSVIDRYSDMTLYLGLIIYFGRADRMEYVVLVGICIMGSMMTSYARARAESLVETCKVGFLERPERVVLLIIGTIFNRVEHVLWVIAILSNWTVISRIFFTHRELGKVNIFRPMPHSETDSGEASEPPAPEEREQSSTGT